MLHFDNNPLTNWDIMPSGFLRIWGTIAKVGWLKYQNNDGSIRWEYVSPEVLFDESHLDSIAGAPITLNHPPEKVTPDNYKQYVVGATGTKIIANQQEGLVDIVTIICDKEAIDSILSGKTRQLSMGYDVETKPSNDINKFNQIKRICNHNAVVEVARAGPNACLHLDAWHSINENNIEASIWRTLHVMA